jgi:hypothetical protein
MGTLSGGQFFETPACQRMLARDLQRAFRASRIRFPLPQQPMHA